MTESISPIILLAGNGNMAGALKRYCESQKIDVISYEEGLGVNNITEKYSSLISFVGPREILTKMVGIHFGSGDELRSFLGFCEQYKIPAIQGSSGIELPENIASPVVNAPNLALPIMKFLKVLPKIAKELKGMNVSMIESHQEAKKTPPGTALAMAKIIKLDEKNIRSIRDPVIQTKLGVPHEFLEGHGYHCIIFEENGVKISLTTEINGRKSYAKGAVTLAKTLLNNRKKLENRAYELSELIQIVEL